MATRISRGAVGDLAKPRQTPPSVAGGGIEGAVAEGSNAVKSLLVKQLALAEEDPGGDPYNRAGSRVLRKT